MSKSSKMKKLLILPLAVVVLLLGVLSTNAAINCNLTYPTSGATINKLTQLNASFNVSGDSSTNNMSVAFEIKASNSINSSYSLIANVSNTTALRHTNLTFADKFVIPDGSSYTLRATCYMNFSQALGTQYTGVSSESTNVIVDRSNPSIRDVTIPGGSLTSGAISIFFGITNATSYEFREAGSQVITRTLTSNVVNESHSEVITPRNGGSFYIVAYDGINTTTSNTVSLTLSGDLLQGVTLQGIPQEITQQRLQKFTSGISSKTKLLTIVVGGSIAFGLIMLLILSSNKKRRRR